MENIKNRYKNRIIDKTVETYLDTFGAVCVEGPKWIGKTWTSKFHAKSEYMVGDPTNNFQNRRLAELSPATILDGNVPRLIDEWQEVPSVWDAVRYVVDERAKKGQFILTGSSTPKYKGIMHSGTGRIAKIRMRTMTLYESGASTGDISLEELCEGKFSPKVTGEVDLTKLAECIVRGGWPGNIDTKIENAALLPESYLTSILENDIQKMDGVKYDTQKMLLLLKSLARNESTTATNKTLQTDISEKDGKKVDVETLATYLDAFDRLFLLDNQLPFSQNVRSSVRVKQQSKRHFCDPAIAAALLQMTPNKLVNDLETFGFLFEAMCERDLRVYAESFHAHLYHYQDYEGREVDAIVEKENGDWCAFEIKLGANKIDEAAKNLVSLKEKIKAEKGKTPQILCVICGLSNVAYQREDGVYVVPLTALKN